MNTINIWLVTVTIQMDGDRPSEVKKKIYDALSQIPNEHGVPRNTMVEATFKEESFKREYADEQ